MRRTTDRTSAPRALICTSWASDSAADAAVGKQRDALRDRRGLDGRPHKENYRNHTVDRVAGKGSLVRAEADTPSGAAVVLAGLNRHDLPGLAPLRRGIAHLTASWLPRCARPVGRALKEQQTEGVNVTGRTRRLTAKLLRRQMGRGGRR